MQFMEDPAEILMRSGIVRSCRDCRADRIFVSIDECDADGCEFCCTVCGAAVLIDPLCDAAVVAAQVA